MCTVLQLSMCVAGTSVAALNIQKHFNFHCELFKDINGSTYQQSWTCCSGCWRRGCVHPRIGVFLYHFIWFQGKPEGAPAKCACLFPCQFLTIIF